MPPAAERALFAALLAVATIPLLAFGYFPSEDGPAHVANAALLFSSPASLAAEYYEIDLSSGTNLLADLLLAGLLTSLSAALADRTMALLLLVGLPLSVRWCLRQVDRDAAWMSILSIPFGTGFLLYFGFYNFLLGVVLSFVAFGFWLRLLRPSRHPVVGIAFAGTAALAYLSHPFPVLALLLLIGATLIDRTAVRLQTRPAMGIRNFIPLLGGSLAVAVAAAFVVVLSLGGSQGFDIRYTRSLSTRIAAFPLDAVLSLTVLEIPFVLMCFGAIALLGVALVLGGRGRLSKAPGLFLAIVVLVVLYLFGPDAIGEGALILPRIALYLPVVVLLASAGCRVSPRLAAAAIALASVSVVGLTVVRFSVHGEEDGRIREYLSGARVVEPGSTVLPLWAVDLSGSDDVGRRVRPLIERAGYLVPELGAVDLHHFPGHLKIFTVRFAPGYAMGNPASETGGRSFQLGPDVVDPERYQEAGPGRIDYVWLWGRAIADSASISHPRARKVLRYIEDNYRLVHVSSPEGLLEVYQRASPRAP